MKGLITGAAGFIGFHLANRLVADGHQILGYDGLTPYYDVALKRQRLALLQRQPGFSFVEAMLEDQAALDKAVADFRPDVVVHLAAQAGVRYSLSNPQTYLDSNIQGTQNLLQALRTNPPRHLLLASSSSIYGGNTEAPFTETSRTDFPISLYAATKKAAEALAHAHSSVYGLPVTCLRIFTVYGPWGRPDMALFKFVEAISAGRPIDVYGTGQMRDFTYVGDLVESIVRLIESVPQMGSPVSAAGVEDSLSPVAPWRTVNIAGGKPLFLTRFIEIIEEAVGRPAAINPLPMQPGDVSSTWGASALLRALTGYAPDTDVETGIKRFVAWHRSWHNTAASGDVSSHNAL